MVFVTAGTASDSPLLLSTDFVAALQSALLILGPLAAAAPAGAHGSPRLSFVLRDGLLCRRSPRGDRLCVTASGELRLQLLRELHATPLDGHFGRGKRLSLARRSVWWPSLPADVEPDGRGVRAELPHMPTRQGRQPVPGRPALQPVQTRRGGCISLDFLELAPARFDHDFLQVHTDLPTCSAWLVPTFKTATLATRNLLSAVFRDGGLPDVLVSGRDTRFTSALWNDLHAAQGASLVFRSQHHHNTTSSKVAWLRMLGYISSAVYVLLHMLCYIHLQAYARLYMLGNIFTAAIARHSIFGYIHLHMLMFGYVCSAVYARQRTFGYMYLDTKARMLGCAPKT